jgi:hypothetical protein
VANHRFLPRRGKERRREVARSLRVGYRWVLWVQRTCWQDSLLCSLTGILNTSTSIGDMRASLPFAIRRRPIPPCHERTSRGKLSRCAFAASSITTDSPDTAQSPSPSRESRAQPQRRSSPGVVERASTTPTSPRRSGCHERPLDDFFKRPSGSWA